MMIDFFEKENIRSTDRWKLPVKLLKSVNEFFNLKEFPKGIFSIELERVIIDLIIDVKKGKPLVFFFNGAADRLGNKDLYLPIFSGLRVLPEGDVSRVYISDPALYLDKALGLAWYAGYKGLDLQKLLCDIFEKIIEIAAPSKVIFFGGSGGGFASLYYSYKFSGSLALVWNPQTNILKYYRSHVEFYSKTAFGFIDINEAKEKLLLEIDCDLCKIYAAGDNKNHVIYLQNRSDKHVEAHCVPFTSALGVNIGNPIKSHQLTSFFYLHGGDWGMGHKAPPAQFLKSILTQLICEEASFGALFKNNMIEILIKKAELEMIV